MPGMDNVNANSNGENNAPHLHHIKKFPAYEAAYLTETGIGNFVQGKDHGLYFIGTGAIARWPQFGDPTLPPRRKRVYK